MFRNPFLTDTCTLMRWADRGLLRDALVAVPVDARTALACRVIVPAGNGPQEWLERAAIAAVVTVHATRARLEAEDTTL